MLARQIDFTLNLIISGIFLLLHLIAGAALIAIAALLAPIVGPWALLPVLMGLFVVVTGFVAQRDFSPVHFFSN